MHSNSRKLSAENRKLYSDVEKEAHDRKRLSMENDELHWKIRQSLDHSYGGNCSGLLSMSVIEGNLSSSILFITLVHSL